MKLETRFNREQSVCIYENAKATIVEIHSIKIDVEKNKTEIEYYFFVGDGNKCLSRPENLVFESKEDLIAIL